MAASGGGGGFNFRDNYWGDGDKGYDVLERLSGAGVDVLAQFASYLEERADAEEQFAKRLRKLHDTGGPAGPTSILHQIAAHASVPGASPSGGAGAPAGTGGGAAVAVGGMAMSSWSAEPSGVPSSASGLSTDGLLGAVGGEACKGLRDALCAALDEARQQYNLHRQLAAAFSALAAESQAALKEQKMARKALLQDAAVCLKERGVLEAAMKKARVRYAESVTKKEAAVNTVAALEAQSRAQADVAKMKAKMHKLAKEEMLLDQELKEAVERFQEYHPTYVARMTALMDGLQKREEQRVDHIRKQLVAAAAALQLPVAAISETTASAARTAAGVSVEKDLSELVRATATGPTPLPPP
jgi:hypothetical protein